jgi:RNA polymerase sigma factor (sigma-70 family)
MSAISQAAFQSRRGVHRGRRQSDAPVPEPAPDLEATIDLLARVQTGDQLAWEVLLKRYLRPLKQLAHNRLPRYVRSMADTDDLVQDALVNTMKRLRYFECRNRGALLGYLRRAVLNRIVDEVRRCARRRRTLLLQVDCPHGVPSPLATVLEKEDIERYREALRRLEPRDRQLIVLRLQHRLTYAQLAQRLSMASPDAARIASTRAVWRLATALKA